MTAMIVIHPVVEESLPLAIQHALMLKRRGTKILLSLGITALGDERDYR